MTAFNVLVYFSMFLMFPMFLRSFPMFFGHRVLYGQLGCFLLFLLFFYGLASHNQQRDRFELDSQNYIVQHILVLGLDCLGALQLEHFRLEGPCIIN
jgi:hypothetical protein